MCRLNRNPRNITSTYWAHRRWSDGEVHASAHNSHAVPVTRNTQQSLGTGSWVFFKMWVSWIRGARLEPFLGLRCSGKNSAGYPSGDILRLPFISPFDLSPSFLFILHQSKAPTVSGSFLKMNSPRAPVLSIPKVITMECPAQLFSISMMWVFSLQLDRKPCADSGCNIHTHTYTYTPIHMHTYIHIHTHMLYSIQEYVHAHTDRHIFVYICIYTFVHMYRYTTYTHTYKYIYIDTQLFLSLSFIEVAH